METILDIVRQELLEATLNRKNIDVALKEFLTSNLHHKINEGVDLLHDYMGKSYYASKNARIDQIRHLDLHKLVLDVYMGIAYCIREELFTSVTGQLAGRLHMSDKTDSIKTIAEIVAVLCATDVYDIMKANKFASLVIKSKIMLPDKIMHLIETVHYLPPMVCEPVELKNNYDSAYLGFNDSLILGKGNHHNGDICIDVLNIMNKVPLKLDVSLLSSVEEEPKKPRDTQEKVEQWQYFKKQSYGVYSLIAQMGNRFYMTHKVDKRGRIYSQGYHINPQGSSFKKSMVELANEELVEVPKEYL